MTKLGAEQTAVQDPMIQYAVDVGWEYLPPEAVEALRGGIDEPFITAVLRERLLALNPGVCDAGRADDVIRAMKGVTPTLEGNERSWEYLTGRRSVFVPEENRNAPVRLLDPHVLTNNRWIVTEEWRFNAGTPDGIRPDIVFAVNGVPVLVVECKSAKKKDGIAEAIAQIRRYHDEGPELMAQTQLHALTHLVKFFYGATWATSRKNLYDWREESAGKVFEALVKAFVDRPRLMRVLTDYVLFSRVDDELSKVVLRPNQMRAAERVVERAADPEKARGLVWHTQGSGKTFTMIKAAQLVLEDPRFTHPLVLLLVDRNDLEQQLFQNLDALGLPAVVADTKEHLQSLLVPGRSGLVVTTIQKFQGMPADRRKGRDVVVLVDEAHRTSGGDLGNFLMGALPEGTYIGFTGTPIDRTAHGEGTFKTFGRDDPKGYLDKYSIKESIDDGTTVRLHYRLAPNDLRVDRETLEREFLALAEAQGVSDVKELNRVLEKAVTLRNMLKNRERIARVAAHVAEDFKARVDPLGYKAFVVAVDREACVLYKEALDQHLPAEWSTVVISGSNNDAPELKRHHLDEAREKKIRKAFRSPQSQPKILIVTEKLLTGFDAPVLYCLYLDKPMRDHVLLQAIARVNRPYEDGEGLAKTAGYVLDFVGIFEKLERALAFDSADVSGVIDGVEELQNDFAKRIGEMGGRYLGIGEGLAGDKQVEAVLEFFREKETRQDFARAWAELEDLYEILSPDPFLRPHLDAYSALARIAEVLRAMYGQSITIDHDFRRKTERLVQQHVEGGAVTVEAKEYKLTPKGLEPSQVKDVPVVKVWDLARRIREGAEKEGHLNPVLRSIGERAERVVHDFEERQTTTQEMLERFEKLAREQQEAREAAARSGLGPSGFAVLWTFTQDKVPRAEEVARVVDAAVAEHPHWQSNEALQRAFKLHLYGALDGLTDDVPALVARIFDALAE